MQKFILWLAQALNIDQSTIYKILSTLLKYDKLTPIVYTSVRDNGVQLTVRYLCHPRARRNSTKHFWEGILSAFEANPDIHLAYPTKDLSQIQLLNLSRTTHEQ